ncbi:MAG: SAM-dependent methyltransferase [Thermoguttaceae bacterium]
MSDRPGFIFATCQVGAEGPLKREVARRWPAFRFAYSRPGFLTFKLPAEQALAPDFELGAVFARAHGFSLGRLPGNETDSLARSVWQLWGQRPAKRIHVWERDKAPPGQRGFEPAITQAAIDVAQKIIAACPRPNMLAPQAADPRQPARPGETVLDCILVGPEQWWLGWHRAGSIPSQWPGGMMPLELPPEAVSRAWLKMEEALWWSQLPIPRGARCAEIGSAPGGASQALLGRGLIVLGIDPAEMDPAVLAHPNFTHLRCRAAQVRRREFRKIRWLMADMNVTPRYTLDVVESIVTHPEVHVRGMLLTLKLLDWKLAEELPEYLDRVRGWGYNLVRARQLQHNRQEVCVAALQKPFVRKRPVRKRPRG